MSACLLASYVFALEALKMLVRAQDTLIDNGVVSGYEEVQTYAGLTGAALGPAGDVLCKALNVITCFGISVGYIIFVSDTLISMLPAATQLTFSTARMIITSLPLWVALSWQRSFKGVNLISLMGTVSVAPGARSSALTLTHVKLFRSMVTLADHVVVEAVSSYTRSNANPLSLLCSATLASVV